MLPSRNHCVHAKVMHDGEEQDVWGSAYSQAACRIGSAIPAGLLRFPARAKIAPVNQRGGSSACPRIIRLVSVAPAASERRKQ